MNISETYTWMFDSMFDDAKASNASVIGLEIEVLITYMSIDEKGVFVGIDHDGAYYDIVMPVNEFENRKLRMVQFYRVIKNHETITIRAFRYDEKREVEFIFK